MERKILSEYAWMQLWGVKTCSRRLVWAGCREPKNPPEPDHEPKPEPVLPGFLVDHVTVEDLTDCVPLTAQPVRMAWWKRLF